MLAHKEELLSEIQEQLVIGPDGLDEQDWFLLECNFNELQLLQGSTKNIGYWQYRQQWKRHTSGHSRWRRHSHAVTVGNGNTHMHNTDITEY